MHVGLRKSDVSQLLTNELFYRFDPEIRSKFIKVNLIRLLISICKRIETIRKLIKMTLKGVLHLWALFLKTLCIFSKNKATSDKVSYGSGQKCSKELENYSFTSVETIVVKLQ